MTENDEVLTDEGTAQDEDTVEEEEVEGPQTEEQLEDAREVSAITAKIEELDARLEEYEAKHIDSIKRTAMKDAHYNDEQVERYITSVDGTTTEEIKASVFKLSMEIPAVDGFADPNAFNGEKARPKIVDAGEVGRSAISKVIHKIRL